MASNANEVVGPTSLRLANQDNATERNLLERDQYSCMLPSVASLAQGFVYNQNLLDNRQNFSTVTDCDIFAVNVDGSCHLRCNLQDNELRNHLTVSDYPHDAQAI